MDDMNRPSEQSDSVEQADPAQSPAEPEVPFAPAPPIESRFLYVDVAALRAKQLRRGARLRFEGDLLSVPFKPERAAMEEVRRQLVHYEVPDPPVASRDAGAGL
jgi:DNA-directed RNA polymerase subunit K/omega